MARHDEGFYCDVKFSSANGEKHICSLAPEHWRQAKAHTCYCGQVMDDTMRRLS
ncbi:MAG TPA: hypothetical protein VN039_12925 [Nitrospira sp.]|nr:hypothetical protein [Nitrospira sp.]